MQTHAAMTITSQRAKSGGYHFVKAATRRRYDAGREGRRIQFVIQA